MLMAAGVSLLVLGSLHSVLGELMIFRHLPRVSGFPALGFPPVVGRPETPHWTLRATWHTPTILAAALAVILIHFATLPALANAERFVVRAIAGSLLACALLWCATTRAKHVGWVGFLAAGVLAWWGAG